jgi:hypothetical protein
VKCSPVRSNELLTQHRQRVDLGRRGRVTGGPDGAKAALEILVVRRGRKELREENGQRRKCGLYGWSPWILEEDRARQRIYPRSEEPSHVINAAVVGANIAREAEHGDRLAGHAVENAELSADVVRQAPSEVCRRVEQTAAKRRRGTRSARLLLEQGLKLRKPSNRPHALSICGTLPWESSHSSLPVVAASRGVETRTIAFELRSAGYRRSQRRRSTRPGRCCPASQRDRIRPGRAAVPDRRDALGMLRSWSRLSRRLAWGPGWTAAASGLGARPVAHWLHHDPRQQLETAGERVEREPVDDRARPRSQRAARLLRPKRAGRSAPGPIPGLSEAPSERAGALT